jgi:hypothetical protein
MTSSMDKFVRIWSLDGKVRGNININHPLPITWDLEANFN